jgi:hypothetical protein
MPPSEAAPAVARNSRRRNCLCVVKVSSLKILTRSHDHNRLDTIFGENQHTQHTHVLRLLSNYMRHLGLVLLLFSAVGLKGAGHAGSRAEYIGGTQSDLPANNSGEIEVADRVYFVFTSKHTRVRIPFERINLLEYGQKVDRRYITAVLISPLFMLAKKRDHFLTVGFQGDDGTQEAMVFKVDKNDIRLALVTLEARTGQAVQYQDDEARLAGKG